jgi:hypothetical protein
MTVRKFCQQIRTLLHFFANSEKDSDTALNAPFAGLLQNAVNALHHLRQEGYQLLASHTRQLLELLHISWKLLQLEQ